MQGGPLSPEEAAAFEQDPMFAAKCQVRFRGAAAVSGILQ